MAEDGRTHIVGEIVRDFDNQEQTFRPDAVVSITSKQKGSSLIFFLEVDMAQRSFALLRERRTRFSTNS